MKKPVVIVLLSMPFLLFAGCAAEKKAVAIRSENRQNLMKLRKGMTREEVLTLMGDKITTVNIGKSALAITNPFKSKVIRANDREYKILYYYTHYDQKDWPFKRFVVLERELTPVVFEDDKLIGWGNEFLTETIPPE